MDNNTTIPCRKCNKVLSIEAFKPKRGVKLNKVCRMCLNSVERWRKGHPDYTQIKTCANAEYYRCWRAKQKEIRLNLVE